MVSPVSGKRTASAPEASSRVTTIEPAWLKVAGPEPSSEAVTTTRATSAGTAAVSTRTASTPRGPCAAGR